MEIQSVKPHQDTNTLSFVQTQRCFWCEAHETKALGQIDSVFILFVYALWLCLGVALMSIGCLQSAIDGYQ